MVKNKLIYVVGILLAVTSSGCVEQTDQFIKHPNIPGISPGDKPVTDTTSKNEQTEQIISKSYDDIYNELEQLYEFSNTDCITKLTEIQCNEKRKEHIEYIRKNINNHYIRLNGKIRDVGRDPYTGLTVIYVKLTGYENAPSSQYGITLYDISEDELIKFNKDEIIYFTGKIGELDKGMAGIVGNWKQLKLYNVKIE